MERERRDGKREKGWEEREERRWNNKLGEKKEGMNGMMIEGEGTSGKRQGDQGWRYKGEGTYGGEIIRLKEQYTHILRSFNL